MTYNDMNFSTFVLFKIIFVFFGGGVRGVLLGRMVNNLFRKCVLAKNLFIAQQFHLTALWTLRFMEHIALGIFSSL